MIKPAGGPRQNPSLLQTHLFFSLNQEIVVIWFKLVLTAPAVDSHDVCVINLIQMKTHVHQHLFPLQISQLN